MEVRIDDVITDLINQGAKSVWFYPTEDSTGTKLFQLLDDLGDELAWRCISDGPLRWRTQMSSLPAHTVRPGDAEKFDLTEGFFQLGIKDAANGADAPSRPDWCR